jgi:transcription elongation factor GreB
VRGILKHAAMRNKRLPGLRYTITMKAATLPANPSADDDDDVAPALPRGTKNYMTPRGYARLKDELTQLLNTERPELVKVVSWAAKNGDRSENGDYLYGKKRLREIDRRIRYLTRRLEGSEVVDPAARAGTEQIFFGATVDYVDDTGAEHTICIVGLDEVDLARGHVSWISPIAGALIKHSAGDTVLLRTPSGARQIEIVDVRYEALQ